MPANCSDPPDSAAREFVWRLRGLSRSAILVPNVDSLLSPAVIIASTADFRHAAQRRLPRFLFDYIDGAAYDERTCRRNVEDLAGITLRQRVLVDVSKISLTTEFFGQRQSMPVALGPVGLSGMYARRGEAQAKRVAADKGIPMCLSTLSVLSLIHI